jgi:hypothetical protein
MPPITSVARGRGVDPVTVLSSPLATDGAETDAIVAGSFRRGRGDNLFVLGSIAPTEFGRLRCRASSRQGRDEGRDDEHGGGAGGEQAPVETPAASGYGRLGNLAARDAEFPPCRVDELAAGCVTLVRLLCHASCDDVVEALGKLGTGGRGCGRRILDVRPDRRHLGVLSNGFAPTSVS